MISEMDAHLCRILACSTLLHHLDPSLRKTAEMGIWQIVSNGAARGELVKMTSLIDIQGKIIRDSQVIIADMLTGNEDIPVRIAGALRFRSYA